MALTHSLEPSGGLRLRSTLCNYRGIQLSSVRPSHRRKLTVSLSAYLRFHGTCKNKRTSARTPTSTPMRVNTGRNLHSATAAWYALRNTCESWISVLRMSFRTKKNVALFLLLFEGTVSETSKVRPRHRVTRLRRTRCVHQKTWGANASQSVRWSKTRPPVSNCKRKVPYCFIYMTVLRSARVKHTGATEAPELLTGEISEGQELESTTPIQSTTRNRP